MPPDDSTATEAVPADARPSRVQDPEAGRAPSEAAPPRSLRASLLEGLVVFLSQLTAMVLATWPLVGRASTHAPMDLGDPLLNAYVVGWGGHAALGNPLRIFDATLYDPENLSLALLENMLGMSLPLAPLYWATDNALLVANLGLVLFPAVAGLGAYLLARELTGSRGVAFVAATAYTVMPVRLAQVTHLHVSAVYAVPYVLLFLVRLRAQGEGRRADVRRVVALGVASAAGVWASLTGAVLMALVVLGWAVWTLTRRPIAWGVLGRAALGLGLGLVLSVPITLPYVALRDRYPAYRHPQEVARTMSATPSSYLSPPRGGAVVRPVYEALAERYDATEAPYEKHLFPGLWLSMASVAGLGLMAYRRHRLAVPALGLCVAAVGFVFSLGPRWGGHEDGMPLPFLVIETLGGLTRVPSRMGAVVPLGLVIVAAWTLVQVPARWRRPVLAASVALLVLEMVPSTVSMVEAPEMTDAHHDIEERGGVVLALPTTEFDDSGGVRGETVPRDTHHLYLSTANFRRIVNGYGSYNPPSYWEVILSVQDFPSPPAWEVFKRRDVRTVVVQTELLPGTRWADVVPRLDATPGVRLVGTGEGVRVYDVTEAAGTAPA
ncbi:MAG TPA: hypothetical protein VHF47_06070 [Acidimicrobiales bacterium]|nr:hypothetical protein [Acidimicrobiales bacterium]